MKDISSEIATSHMLERCEQAKKNHRLEPILENRIKAFVVDYLIMGIIGFLIFTLTDNIILAMFIVYPITMNKDFLNGKSIGKRLFGIQVQNLNNQKASEWRSSLRNFLPIIPIDLLFTVVSPKRRIGDRIAETKIGVETKQNLKTCNYSPITPAITWRFGTVSS